jgi:hypothetical protein
MGSVLKIPQKIIGSVPVVGKPLESLIGKVTNPLVDTLVGVDQAATPNEIIDMASPEGRKLQEQLLGQYGQGIGKDTNGIAQQQITAQENQIMQNAADQKTRAEQLVAQRGLGRTASGIGAILNQQRGVADQIGAVRSQLPGLQEQMRQQNLNFASSGINQILNEQGQSKVLKMGQAARPSNGGLLAAAAPIAGSVLGGMAGSGAFNKLVPGGPA